MAGAAANAVYDSAVSLSMPFVMSVTATTNLCIVAVTRSVINWLRILKTGTILAFINESDFMADRRKAKSRVPRHLVRLLRDGALRAGSAPYGAIRAANEKAESSLPRRPHSLLLCQRVDIESS
jgi:hypothetical protein